MPQKDWALRKFRYNSPEKKAARREKKRQERDAVYNPPRDNDGGGFGM
jgi:hypothetical protein